MNKPRFLRKPIESKLLDEWNERMKKLDSKGFAKRMISTKKVQSVASEIEIALHSNYSRPENIGIPMDFSKYFNEEEK